MKIALVPIDNRPVCYNLPREIANIDDSLELFMPDKKLLGGLSSQANIDGILHWLEKVVNSEHEIDAIVVSLDTIAYGGLIASRRCKNSVDEIESRLEKLKKILLKSKKVYAFSSVMRISNNNVNEEEKEYWDKYGEKIFEYSYNFHKEGTDDADVPQEILNDYLATRRRNFKINQKYIEWLKDGIFDTLVFSKDDCAEYGFNVLEADILKRMIKEITQKQDFSESGKSGFVKTGADEIPLTLFARAVCNYNKAVPKISLKFLAPEYKDLISNYEDISIEKSAQAQIELGGGILADKKDSDIVLLVNNFEEKQGEIVMKVKTQPFSGQFNLPKKPYIIADVRFANGADNNFIDKLFKKPIDFDNFYGYSAWNTSANTLGSLICAGIVRFFAKKYNENSFKKLQMVRFLDDWAYQANVRQALKVKQLTGNGEWKEPRPDFRKLQKIMHAFEKKLSKLLSINPQIKYKFPWKRFFEVEIIVR
jgi:hypothetical protein